MTGYSQYPCAHPFFSGTSTEVIRRGSGHLTTLKGSLRATSKAPFVANNFQAIPAGGRAEYMYLLGALRFSWRVLSKGGLQVAHFRQHLEGWSKQMGGYFTCQPAGHGKSGCSRLGCGATGSSNCCGVAAACNRQHTKQLRDRNLFPAPWAW